MTAPFERIGYSSLNLFTVLRVSYLVNRSFLPEKGRFFMSSLLRGYRSFYPRQ
jgi:hypothetical protein